MAAPREQIALRLPIDVAHDARGIVDAREKAGEKGMNLTRWILEQIDIGIQRAIEDGIRWKATPPGKIKRGRPPLPKKETTT